MPRQRILWRSLTLAAIGLFVASSANGQEPPRRPVGAGEAAEELVRGPIHEAFGQPTVFNPQAGPVVPNAPPELVEEVPPDQKPEGDNVTWISGYWHWEDDAKSHIWISGFWRSIPPDRTWVGGYWSKTDEGHQWVSGYWASVKSTEVEYLPPPPESLETGPSTEATVGGQIWVPGCWVWQTTRYVWRPGFWAAGHADWVWTPAHYVWTPGGHVFIEGYWDYPMVSRGLLFSPVVFHAPRPGFVYTPAVVIDIRFVITALFVRPSYHHYYFGDYYDQTYARGGIYPWYAFHMSRYGYDPLYAHSRFVYSGRDPRWDAQLREGYALRRENVAARPPRKFREFNDWARKSPDTAIALARPLTEVGRDRDFPVRVERVDERRLEVVKTQAKQVREFREARAKSEQEVALKTRPAKGAKVGAARESVKVKMPEAPKLGAATGAKGSAAAPPTAPRVPDLTPDATPGTAPKGKARPLPDPEDVVRPDPTPKVKGTDPKPGKKDPPAKVDPPLKKDPLPKVDPPPRKDPPPKIDPPPKKDPPPKLAPKKDPPKKDPPPKKDKDKDKDKDDKDKD